MVIITKKVKCNGSKFQGYKYYVNVTDGNMILSFNSNGGDKLRMEDFKGAELSNSKRYHYDPMSGLNALPLFGDGRNDNEEERDTIMLLAHAALDAPIVFVGEDCEHTYIA